MKFGLTIISLAFLSCSREISFPVRYTEYHDPSVASFEDEEYIFKTADEFEYVFFTDAIDYSRYGYGNYLIENHRLILNFTEKVVEPESTIESEEFSMADSSYNHYKVAVKSSSGMNLESVSVLLADSKGSYLKGIATDSSGTGKITLSKGNLPILLKIFSLGYDYLDYNITVDENRTFVATLVERNFGTRITNKQWKKSVRRRKDALIIDGKKFVKKPIANPD